MWGLQLRAGLAVLIRLLAEGEDDHIIVKRLHVQLVPEQRLMQHAHAQSCWCGFPHMSRSALVAEGLQLSVAGQCRCDWWHAKPEACPREGAGDFEVVGLDLDRAPHLAQPWALGPVLTAQTLSMHNKECLTMCL